MIRSGHRVLYLLRDTLGLLPRGGIVNNAGRQYVSPLSVLGDTLYFYDSVGGQNIDVYVRRR